ncbi:hypothetical protein HGM15179_017062 [Zosterops borbonicus]|uniref:Uncharacterized protein n=1 Tax=Zosterops borbonicus TaxID=364589 RepID=A0A8K1LDQ0_9PASS|nr:hypothetical protein HGM15179_017062 [Zosterops borbonicus]
MEMDGDPRGSKDAGVIEKLEITEVCENHNAGLRASTLTIAQVKCICTRGSKQEEQEFIMQQEKLIQLPSWKPGGEAPTPGVLQGSPVSLTSVPEKIMEQIILSATKWNVQDKQGIRPSQPGLVKGRSCLTNLVSSYDRMTCLVDEGKAVDVST